MGISHGKMDHPLPPEEWRDVPEYGGVIQASSHGRIRRKKPDGSYRNLSIIIHGGCKNNQHKVTIYWNGRYEQHTVLRLVGMAFFPGQVTGGDVVVRHRNGMQWDNTVWNVQILPRAVNGRQTGGTLRKAVLLIDRNGETVECFRSIAAASRATGLCRKTVRVWCDGKGWGRMANGASFRWG